MIRLLAALLALHSVAFAAFQEPLPGVYLWQDTCNVYVLKHGDRALLINLGDGSVLEHLGEIGVKQVEWVLFTDHHRELCQGVLKLNRAVTQIAVPKDEQAFFETPNEFRKWNPRLSDKFAVHGSSYVRPPSQPVKIDKPLADGDVFNWNGFALACVSTPGHSPGGMSFVLKQGERTLAFTGGVMHDGAKMTNWFDTEWDYGFAKGLDALIATVDKLIALEPEISFPSQGPVIANATAQFKTYKERLTQFRPDYVRGYPTEKLSKRGPHPATQPTKAHYIVQVTPHLYMFGPEMAGKNFAIIIADSGHALLLDCGLFPKLVLERIISDMREFLGLKQIDACWISHSHGDHFTLFPALKDHGVKFWTMDSIADKCENPRYYDYPAMIGAYNAGFEQAKIDRILKAGDVIEWEGYKLHIDWMPGQTEFGNALWLELDGKKIVFSGDNLFGDPADPAQNGHECVNARNSAIIEEGYLVAAKYLQKLQPDIIMGAHGVLMTEPKAFIERYHEWALRIIREYKELLPDANYEYLYDPYWVSAYPYRVDFQQQRTQEVSITVRNFRDTLQQHRVELQLPPGVSADPAILTGTVGPKSRQSFKVKLTADTAQLPAGVQLVPMDITLDGRQYGQLFDFIIQAREPEKKNAK
ncbi:MBL fold metallo-hydrolase [Prosthecobacter sp.]|uniref:MBL fold metallo-hydrolase n=1 Tax=Prosthecobacter sp. TaxID=1965333 RepID=UPI00248778E0|nr:MBL fold metallo-hydrolase [Prosthecobacter sp.]MDI1311103.1 MBL fold metallo-hydrolase [Prosthecobacter sp.]